MVSHKGLIFNLLFVYLFIYLFIHIIQGKTLLAIGYFAYVPCLMTSIYIKYENTN